MVMTILEGIVSKENWPILEQAFQQGGGEAPPGLMRSFLIHSVKDPEIWRILTIWASREALDAMRGSVQTPAGVLMFRSAHSEPTLSLYDIANQFAPV